MGTQAPDDAAVFLVRDDLALVQTVDFFTPVVDDPYTFGQIAAANALSDVWAMGADPVFALNIVAFPTKTVPLAVLAQIMRGGADKCAEAGVAILGGHSIEDPEPKYGLVATGFCHPGAVLTKGGGQPGDVLILTKPIGTGVITTALKQDAIPPAVAREAVGAMLALNGPALAGLRAAGGVRACTDITGYGLLGHLREMAAAGSLAATVRLSDVPVLEAAWDPARRGIVPGGSRRNRQFLEPSVSWDPAIPEEARILLCDAVTSGGLLAALPPGQAGAALAALRERHIQARAIGTLDEGPAGRLTILP